MVTLFEGTDTTSEAYTAHSPVSVFSAVRSHNVPRISKSYGSFGNRFTTTIIDDLASSDLSETMKGA